MSVTLVYLQINMLLMVCVGLIGKKVNYITEGFSSGMSKFLINISLPCTIINAFLSDDSKMSLDSAIKILIYSVAIKVFYSLLGELIYGRVDASRKAPLKYAVLVPNVNFMGLPIMGEVYGAPGQTLLSLALTTGRIYDWTIGLSYYTEGSTSQRIKSLLKTPPLWAAIIGLGFMLFDVQLWNPLDQLMASFAKCTLPISMLMLGCVMSRLKLSVLKDKSIYFFCLLRLILIPVFILFVMKLIGFTGTLGGVCVLMTALPSGTTAMIFADTYGKDVDYIAACVATSTILSLFTIPVIEMLCKTIL